MDLRKHLGDANLRHGMSYGGYDFLTSLYKIFGFVLFIIPGIYLSIRYAFGSLMIAFDGIKSGEARVASAKLVQGKYWAIIWRFISSSVAFAVLPMIVGGLIIWRIGVLLPNTEITTVILSLLAAAICGFIAIMCAAYKIVLFDNLKESQS